MGTRKNNKSSKKIRKTRSKRQRGGGIAPSRHRAAGPNIKRTDLDIMKAVNSVCSTSADARAQAEAIYGNISDWDVSWVTNMKELFSGKKSFNSDISRWDVSGVTNMEHMFYGAHAFNQPIGCWDVKNVTNMAGMFYGAHAFNQPIGCWDVKNVTNMESMFYDALVYDRTMLQPKKSEDRTVTEKEDFKKQCPDKNNGSTNFTPNGGKRKSKKSKRKSKKSKIK